jgi:PAS domain S-box-containing protein
MKAKIILANWPKCIAVVSGGLCAALGLIVLVGWHTHHTALLQIHPSFVAMVYNTALGFLLCGTALLAIALGRPRLAIIGGAYAVIIGLLSLGEFLLARDFGIDQFFMQHYVLVANSHPGRMALNSAVFFPFVGLGILLSCVAPRFRSRPLIVGIVGALTFAQGLVAFSGYLTGITTTYAWGNLTRMAIHTAFGFAMIGVGLIALAWQEHRAEERTGAPQWLPILVGVIVVAITMSLWQALVVDQRAQTKRTIEARATIVRNEVTVQLQAHLLALSRLARRWQIKTMLGEQERKFDAGLLIGDYKGFDDIQLVSPSSHILWTIPSQGHEVEQGTYLAFEEHRMAALEAARNTGRLTVSRPVELATGGKGFLIIVPLSEGDNFAGYIAGFSRVHGLLDSVLSDDVTSGYAVVVSEGTDEIYRHGEVNTQQGSEWANTEELALPGMDWRVEVWPEKKMLAELQSSVPTLTLIMGLLISLILAWTVRLTQVARSRSKIVVTTSKSLEREVAERICAEQALSAALEKERVLLNNAVDVICTVDADGRFASLNPACLQLWGYSQEELIGRRYIELVVPEDVSRSKEAAAKITAGETATDFENRYLHKDGSQVHVMWSATWSEKQQLMFCVARDVTRRQLAEEKLQKFAVELQRSNAELQDFASVASHDLQEPLRKIQSFADELRTVIGDKIEANERDTLERIIAAAGRMRTLINDLLAFSRVTTMAKPFVPVDLGLTVNEVLSDLEARVRDTGGQVLVGELPTIDADPMQMRQLLQNLIGNGLKFHRAGVSPIIKISGQNGGPHCRLSIEDNGIGFDEKYLDRIFTVFQRLHGRKEYEGTGIGLAICRKIAERHGGEITARSAPGEGATFTVTLPMKQSKEEQL